MHTYPLSQCRSEPKRGGGPKSDGNGQAANYTTV